MSKITKATFKSFMKKNEGSVLIRRESAFDGMTDCVQADRGASFVKVSPADYPCANNFGVQGVWLVGGSGNSFSEYNDGVHKGIHVYNCCGSFTVATR
jgi:hypothetical protein